MSDTSAETPTAVSTSGENPTKPRRSGRWWLLIAMVVVLLAAGVTVASLGLDVTADLISPSLVDVRGKVTYNGKPLTDGFVQTFYARKGWMGALGIVEKDGTFQLTTNGDPGVFSGDHRVVVMWMDNRFPPKHLLPDRYTQPDTTPLVIHVSRWKSNEILLELTDAP